MTSKEQSTLSSTSHPSATWRPLSPEDLPQVHSISSTIHPDLPESEDVFRERIELFNAGCLGLEVSGEEGGSRLIGYAIAHPIFWREPPELDSLLGEIDVAEEGGKGKGEGEGEENVQFYIHDLALLPEARGTGFAQQAIEKLVTVGKESGYASAGLVSVYGTAGFWGRYGFGGVEVGKELREKLEGYGDGAVWLERRIK